jgi:hypothetical protein
MTDGQMSIERDNQAPLEPLTFGDRPPPGGHPPAPPGTAQSGQPDLPEHSPYEALIDAGKWRGFVYKSELLGLISLVNDRAETASKPVALRTLIGAPKRRRQIRMLSRPFREMGIAVRRG